MKKQVFLFLVVLVILALLGFNFVLPRLNLFPSEEPPKPGEFGLTPVLISPEENIYQVDVNFKTGETRADTRSISAISFKLTYPRYSENEVSVVTKDGKASQKVFPGVSLSKDWNFPVNVVTVNKEGVTIEFAAVYTNPRGFSSSDFVTLATVYFKSEKELKDDAFVLSFDSDDTAILTKSKPTENIRDDSKLYYSVEE